MLFKDGFIPREEIACHSFEDAAAIQKILLENSYVVMLSREEQCWIVNYIWSPTADRNDVIFYDRGTYELEELNHSEQRGDWEGEDE